MARFYHAQVDRAFRGSTIRHIVVKESYGGYALGRGFGTGSSGAMIVSSYISGKAVKGQASGIQGRGLLATAPISAGEIVAIKGGHIVDTATLHALPARLRNSEIQIADGFHLVALQDEEYEPVMLFINHSCEPNVGFAGNVVLVAMRDVTGGEELTTDYALFDDCDDQMECRCGAGACRGTISGRDWQRPDLQHKYGCYFSTFLSDRMATTGDRGPGDQAGQPARADQPGSQR